MTAPMPLPPGSGEPRRAPALRLDADAEEVGRGLGGLVVALLDIVRELLERQALRRVDAGDLTPDEVERLGQALIALEERFVELREVFGVGPEDLHLPVDLQELMKDTGTEREGTRQRTARPRPEARPEGRRP